MRCIKTDTIRKKKKIEEECDRSVSFEDLTCNTENQDSDKGIYLGRKLFFSPNFSINLVQDFIGYALKEEKLQDCLLAFKEHRKNHPFKAMNWRKSALKTL